MTWILGKIWISSDFLEYSRHCCIPYMGICGCRPRVTKSRPFLIPCSMSYFRLWNSSFGRCKIIQFGHNLGRDLHIVFAFVTKYWRWVHFPFALLLVVLWNFIPVKCQRRSPQTRLGLKKYFSSACSIVSKCAVWARWVVWAKSYNIQRNNATKTFTVKACMFMNRENKFNLAMHMLLACPYYQW